MVSEASSDDVLEDESIDEGEEQQPPITSTKETYDVLDAIRHFTFSLPESSFESDTDEILGWDGTEIGEC